MVTIFLISTMLLVLFLFFRYIEILKGFRFFENKRRCVDKIVENVNYRLKSKVKHLFEYIHRDVLLNGLHMIMYVVLTVVRLVENKLENITTFLKKFRKPKKKGSRKLRTVAKEKIEVDL